MSDSGKPRESFNWFLALLGCGLIGASVVGFFQDRDSTLIGGYLICGAGLCLIAVLSSRLEGNQELTLQGVKLTLATKRVLEQAELDLSANEVTQVDAVEAVVTQTSAPGTSEEQSRSRPVGSPSIRLVLSSALPAEIKSLSSAERGSLLAHLRILEEYGAIPGEQTLDQGAKNYKYSIFSERLAVFYRELRKGEADAEVSTNSREIFVSAIGKIDRDPRLQSLVLINRDRRT